MKIRNEFRLMKINLEERLHTFFFRGPSAVAIRRRRSGRRRWKRDIEAITSKMGETCTF